MRLFLVRHAEAAPGEPDDLRPLTPVGRDTARELGTRLAVEQPEAVLTSPLLRARETAAAIAGATGAELRIDERLAPGATASGVLEAVAGAGGTVVTVGHQPDCSEIAYALGAATVDFPPAGTATIELP